MVEQRRHSSYNKSLTPYQRAIGHNVSTGLLSSMHYDGGDHVNCCTLSIEQYQLIVSFIAQHSDHPVVLGPHSDHPVVHKLGPHFVTTLQDLIIVSFIWLPDIFLAITLDIVDKHLKDRKEHSNFTYCWVIHTKYRLLSSQKYFFKFFS